MFFDSICQIRINLAISPATSKVNDPSIVFIINNDVVTFSVASGQSSTMDLVDGLSDLAHPLLPSVKRYRVDIYIPETSARNPSSEKAYGPSSIAFPDVAHNRRCPYRSAAFQCSQTPGLAPDTCAFQASGTPLSLTEHA